MSVFRVLNLVFLSFGACIIFLRTFKYNYKKAQAAWLRCFNGATFASLKKYPSDFFNSDFVGTEPKEAPYEITGNSVEVLEPISFESYMLQMFQLIFYFVA